MSKPPPYDNRNAIDLTARLVTNAKGEHVEIRTPTRKGGLVVSLTQELAGEKERHAIPFYHLRKKLGIPLAVEMCEVKKHWHAFQPRDAGLTAKTGDVVTYKKRLWKVVSAGQYSLILQAHEQV